MHYVIVYLFGGASFAFGYYFLGKKVAAIVTREVDLAQSETVRELSALHNKLDHVLHIFGVPPA